jgi:hypothetical protein
MSTDLIPKDDFKVTISDLKEMVKDRNLPSEARLKHGCFGCEWRGTKMCPYRDILHTMLDKEKGMYGICLFRELYLMSFYGGQRTNPTYKEWRNEFNKGILQNKMQDYLRGLNQIDDSINEINHKIFENHDNAGNILDMRLDTEYKTMLKKLEQRRYQTNEMWMGTMTVLMKDQNKQQDRESRENMSEKLIPKLSITDIYKIMSDEVIDADYDEDKHD